MFYKDTVVDIPKKKRIRRNGIAYVYEILSRKTKKSKEKVVCVGIAITETTMNPNEKYYEIHKEIKNLEPLKEPPVFDDTIYIGASLLCKKICKKEGLINILEECFPGKSDLIITLAEYYSIRRDSTSQLFKYYLSNHFTNLNYIPSDTELSKLFNEQIDNVGIKNFLEKWLKYRLSCKGKCKNIDIDFDSTNRNISSSNIVAAEYGKAKVDEGLKQINTAYFLDRDTGLPIYFDIYYGSIVDMNHCQIALEKVRSIDPEINGTIVLDRGYFSSKNIEYMLKNNINFVFMAKNCKKFNDLIVENEVSKITQPENRIYKTTYGFKTKGKPFEDSSKELNLYLYYNEKDVAIKSSNLQDQIERACSFLVGKKDEKGHIENTYGKQIIFTFDPNTKVITSAIPNYEYLKEYKKTIGYFLIVSNKDESLESILKTYRFRDCVEKEMMHTKSSCDLNKTFASSDQAFEAKILLGFISSIVRSALIVKLKPYFLQYSSETSQTVLLELDKIKAERFGDSYKLKYALTAKQKQILALFDMTAKHIYESLDLLNQNMAII